MSIPRRRLSLFGIAATASGRQRGRSRRPRPPQSLWNRGDCFGAVVGSPRLRFSRLSLFGIAATASGSAEGWDGRGDPPQSLWNRGDCFMQLVREARRELPPQSLWNRGDCFFSCARPRRPRATASVSLESRRLLRWKGFAHGACGLRLSLFGIAATASPARLAGSPLAKPPQSLWNRGDCFVCQQDRVFWDCPASVSLESRRLLPASELVVGFADQPPQSLWNRGDCFSRRWAGLRRPWAASVSLESRRLLPDAQGGAGGASFPPQSLWNRGDCFDQVTKVIAGNRFRLSLFGIAATASEGVVFLPAARGPPQSLWNRGDCFSNH